MTDNIPVISFISRPSTVQQYSYKTYTASASDLDGDSFIPEKNHSLSK